MSSAYGAPAYHDLDYGEEILNAHEVSQLAAKVQKYPPLPPSHSIYHHSTPKPLPVVHNAVHHPPRHPPPPPPVTPHPPPPPLPVAHHVEPLPVPYDPYLEYDYPTDLSVSFI